jgi:DNA-binding transcriptional regulator LsrR (DeoR family)
MSDNENNEDLMVSTAWMYYNDNMTHQQIAEKLRISRVRVTRLLQKARSSGIVEIRITRPLPFDFEIAHKMEERFNLRDVIVVKGMPSMAATLDEIGRAAIDYLQQIIEPGHILGFGWSSTVSHMAAYTDRLECAGGCQVVDLVGSMLGQMNPYSVSGKVADALGVPLAALSVPVIVQSEVVYDAILHEPNIAWTLDLARRCTIAVVGVGDMGPNNALVAGGYIKPAELNSLRARGVVGEVLMRFYDIDGQHIELEADRRIIGLNWADLSRIPNLVVLAAGPTKPAPLLGLLRSGLCHTLITDLSTARSVLTLDGVLPT